jgi:hypothetical protein
MRLLARYCDVCAGTRRLPPSRRSSRFWLSGSLTLNATSFLVPSACPPSRNCLYKPKPQYISRILFTFLRAAEIASGSGCSTATLDKMVI